MQANCARTYRLYPDDIQSQRLTSWSHSCRAVWNCTLAQRIRHKSPPAGHPPHSGAARRVAKAGKENQWLRELPARTAQQIPRQLDAAHHNFCARQAFIGSRRNATGNLYR
ncbi:helix-turn-helix domain-containing protein [Saccharopolyspora sp. NPDC000995]